MELQDAIAAIERAAGPLAIQVHDLGAGADPIDVSRSLERAWLLLSEPEPSERSGHDIIGFAPFLELRATGDAVALSARGTTYRGRADGLQVLERVQAAFAGTLPPDDLPLGAGAIAVFSYDLGRAFEDVPATARDDLSFPWLIVTWFTAYLVRSVRTGRWTLLVTELPPALSASPADLVARARAALARSESLRFARRVPLIEPTRTFTHARYLATVATLVEAIHQGDVFQVNLAQRFSGPLRADPHELFAALRERSPVPFAALIDDGSRFVLSASPERFLKVTGRCVEAWPIKGTARRRRDAAADRSARQALLESAKDGAELAMIIDLERNDLGRVCEPGSIRVREAVRLQTLPNVHHLHGVVEGRLAAGTGLGDLLRATFPGGSITGAPKLAAMHMIERFEPVRRAVYTGSIGYLAFDGRIDLNIAIRTVLVEGGIAHLSVGGGIVADSEPSAEYQEILAKAGPLLDALRFRAAES